MKYLLFLVFTLFSFCVIPEGNVVAEEKTLYIYQDADLSNHAESSESIQKGIEVAFDEIGNQMGGYQIKFKYLDHRGNVARSKLNYKKFLADPKALAIYSGIHSPPLIKNRTFINENKALTLVPWAAGGPITRFPSAENWIFRLSVDDTRAGPVIIDFAMKNKNCKNPHLLLENTPWGDSNQKSMSKRLKHYGINLPHITRFSWNLSAREAREHLRKIGKLESDCIILVSNAVEGAVIVQEIVDLPADKRPSIISHWGITGGDFHEKITTQTRENIDLHFIQSCFSFTNPEQSPLAKKVFTRLKNYSKGKINQPQDLKSAVGFIHAYDLTKLLIQAVKQLKFTGELQKDRNALRLALENIKQPIEGLVKTYQHPFSVFNEKDNTNAHEALSHENYCMGKYTPDNSIVIVK